MPVAKRGLQDRITVLFDDYRDLTGTFDKLVSIEMIEAVGHQFYDTYFQKVSRLLKPHGKAVIQAITMTEQRYEQARDLWTSSSATSSRADACPHSR